MLCLWVQCRKEKPVGSERANLSTWSLCFAAACREDMKGEEESGREKTGWDCLQARDLGRPFQAGLGGVGLPNAGSSPLSACILGTVWSRRLALESTSG